MKKIGTLTAATAMLAMASAPALANDDCAGARFALSNALSHISEHCGDQNAERAACMTSNRADRVDGLEALLSNLQQVNIPDDVDQVFRDYKAQQMQAVRDRIAGVDESPHMQALSSAFDVRELAQTALAHPACSK